MCAALLVAATLGAPKARAESEDRGPGVSLLGGYTFRSAADDRQHGVGAAATLESPSLGALALRLDGLALWVPGSTRDEPGTIARDLSLVGGALSLTYRFDDADIEALLSAGPLVGVALDGDAAGPWGGALVGLGLRFPVLDIADVEARLLLPVTVYSVGSVVPPLARTTGDGTPLPWPLQVAFLVGVHLDPLLWLAEPVPPRAETREDS